MLCFLGEDASWEKREREDVGENETKGVLCSRMSYVVCRMSWRFVSLRVASHPDHQASAYRRAHDWTGLSRTRARYPTCSRNAPKDFARQSRSLSLCMPLLFERAGQSRY